MMCFDKRRVYNPFISFQMFKEVVLKVSEAGHSFKAQVTL